MERQVIQHYRSNIKDKVPQPNDIDYGEIAINYSTNGETLYIKNDSNEIIEYKDKKYIDNEVQKLITNTELKFFCIEPVTVSNHIHHAHLILHAPPKIPLSLLSSALNYE
jgi:hypothetical protein